jgi:hypothetical protein
MIQSQAGKILGGGMNPAKAQIHATYLGSLGGLARPNVWEKITCGLAFNEPRLPLSPFPVLIDYSLHLQTY